ncbi:hypothetical protein JQR85_13675 [Stutzerimonas urumqiensis]|uniref:hypothetical protein n=1 Tax=Stutzerimonas urumqiensis TaxID=638269 RepID=UPI003DA1DD33
MAGVKLRGQLEAKWEGEQLNAAVTSTEDLGRLAVRLLVEDVGTEAARELLRDELAGYVPDYRGAGVDERNARRDLEQG